MHQGTNTFSLDVSPLFAAAGLSTNMVAEMNEHTYEVDLSDPRNNWLYPAFLGFKELQKRLIAEGKFVETFATIGTGPGIDAIGAHEIFHPRKIVMTDIHPDVLPIAEKNFSHHTKNDSIPHDAWQGHLAEPLRRNNILSDVIYPNLPNVPFVQHNTSLFSQQLTSSFYNSVLNCAPSTINRYLLTMQFDLLQDARSSLVDGGSVVVNLGGRVPVELVKVLFESSGYVYEELFTMLKAQSQPELMLPSYARAEKEGRVEFDFYHFDEARNLIKKLPAEGVPADHLKEILLPFRVSATQAVKLSKHHESIGHVVQIIRGVKE